MIGYILWTLLVLTILAGWGGLIVWLEAQVCGLAAGAVLLLGLALIFGCLFYAINEGEKPPPGQVKWKGGQGPSTTCWYADEDDPSQAIPAGKTVIVVDPGTTSRFTYCSTNGKNLPEGAGR